MNPSDLATSARRLRVLVVYPVPNPDTCNLCAGLRARGHDVEFFTSFALSREQAARIPAPRLLARCGLPLQKRAYAELRGVRLTLRPQLALRARFGRTRDAYALFDRAAARRVARGNYDVVVAPIGGCRRVFAAARAAGVVRVLNLPIVPLACLARELEAERAISPERARGFGLTLNPARFAQEAAEMAAANGVLAPSAFVEESVRECFRLRAPIFQVPFGAPPPVPPTSRSRRAGPLRVLFAGQLVQRKGIFDLLDAMGRLAPGVAELHVAGPAPFGTAGFGAAFARARYAGVLARDELSRLMGECDVLCLPTLAEGFPLVVLEAMAVGLPVIATDVCRGVIRSEDNGLLVPPRAPTAIAAAIARLHADPTLLENLARGARATAARFTWADYQQGAARAVEQIVAASSPRRCVLVAPFDPDMPAVATGLGATRKIAGVVRMFKERGWAVTVIDSSHSRVGRGPARVRRVTVAPGLRALSVSPATSARRAIGKLRQLIAAPVLARRVARQPGDLLWIYNAYAFEARFARAFLRRRRVPLVVELEDWPLTRSRGWHGAKNVLDWLGLQWAVRRAAVVTCVNEDLAARPSLKDRAMIFPGLVDSLTAVSAEPSTDRALTLGYFGGLSVEKGADLILALVPRLPTEARLIVTGDGALAEAFRQAAMEHPRRLEFHGVVREAELPGLQARCDAFLNPHRPIAEMGNGIFPFKVFEYVSRARPVISTRLPPVTPDASPAILFIEPTVDALEGAVNAVRVFSSTRKQEIEQVAAAVARHASRSGVYDRLMSRLEELRQRAART